MTKKPLKFSQYLLFSVVSECSMNETHLIMYIHGRTPTALFHSDPLKRTLNSMKAHFLEVGVSE